MIYLVFIPWVLLVSGAVLAHLRVVPPVYGFAISVLSIPAAVLLVLIVVTLRMRGWDVSQPLVLCAVVLLPCAILAFTGRNAVRYPRINDVSTDLADPPAFMAIAALPENRERDVSFPQTFADAIRRTYPGVKTCEWRGGHDLAGQVYAAAVESAKARSNWTLIRKDDTAHLIEAIVESRIYRFRDYIVIRISQGNNRVLLDMRSKSRDGQSDLGVNAGRIRVFLGEVRSLVEPEADY